MLSSPTARATPSTEGPGNRVVAHNVVGGHEVIVKSSHVGLEQLVDKAVARLDVGRQASGNEKQHRV